MPETIPPARIVLTTVANAEEASRLGRALVEERLAACATLIPAVESIYRWQGEVKPCCCSRPVPINWRPSKSACANYTTTRRRSSWFCA